MDRICLHTFANHMIQFNKLFSCSQFRVCVFLHYRRFVRERKFLNLNRAFIQHRVHNAERLHMHHTFTSNSKASQWGVLPFIQLEKMNRSSTALKQMGFSRTHDFLSVWAKNSFKISCIYGSSCVVIIVFLELFTRMQLYCRCCSKWLEWDTPEIGGEKRRKHGTVH